MRRKIAILISSSLLVATTVTLLVVLLPYDPGHVPGFDWSFPSNSTEFSDYVIVPYEVPMSDGICLATDVLIPIDINESLPVIFVRTPYGKEMMYLLSIYTNEDYIVVLQDFRGFFDSQGEKGLPFITEQSDGKDSLLWITNQPWCNGKIGTWGPSALGIAQYLLAPNAPSSLKCQLPIVATTDIYEAIFRGGQLRNELIIPWIQSNDFPEDIFDTIQNNEKLNGIWEAGRVVDEYSDINVPALHMGGWYDIFTQDTINAFMGYQYEGGIDAKGNSKLIMGPWVHEGMFGQPSGVDDFTFPNQGLNVLIAANNALFNKWLKGNSSTWDMLPTVSFYLMSSIEYNPLHLANKWFQSNIWPINSNPLDYYFYSNNSLLSSPNSASTDSLSYLYDPYDPVVTIGGGNLALDAGIYDQSSVETRDDVLVFSTPTLNESLTIVGQIDVTLYASSNCMDTDFTVKLTDVYPDGKSMIITDTILRARNRNSYSVWDFLAPGVVYELNIPLDSTAYLFNEGHKLRIDISSSNYPRFERNPNTVDGLWANQTTYKANNTIHMNSIYQSKITIPSVDYSSLIPFSFYDITYSLHYKDLKLQNKFIIQSPNPTEFVTSYVLNLKREYCYIKF